MIFRSIAIQVTGALLMYAAGVAPASAESDNIIASWTVVSATDPSYRNDYTLAMCNRVLTLTDVNSSKLVGVHGQKDTASVRLTSIKFFDADAYPNADGANTYRIGIYAKGEDVVHTTWSQDEGTTTDHNGSATAAFGSDQRKLRV